MNGLNAEYNCIVQDWSIDNYNKKFAENQIALIANRGSSQKDRNKKKLRKQKKKELKLNNTYYKCGEKEHQKNLSEYVKYKRDTKDKGSSFS